MKGNYYDSGLLDASSYKFLFQYEDQKKSLAVAISPLDVVICTAYMCYYQNVVFAFFSTGKFDEVLHLQAYIESNVSCLLY